ncbi:MAG: hypothetical protein RBT80_18875 [Candidatus Vecturithrix sp.]|nr:hypothetical protein [Candidatus Vecturithrix sp.]
MKDIALELTVYQCRGIADNDSLASLVERVLAAGFEFNEIPDDLLRMLKGLAQEHKNLAWEIMNSNG